jgi:polyferredoxin
MGAATSGLVGGRVFCGAVCPVGTVQDWLQSFKRRAFSSFHYLMRLVFRSKGSASKGSAAKVGKSEGILGRGLRLLKYPLFLLVSLYALIRFALAYDFMPDWGLIPALNFTMEVRRIAGPEYIYFWLFFLGIVLGVGLIWHRPWCKNLCPAGLLFAVFNKISFLRIKLARKGCTGYREYLKDCTTGKPLSKLEKGFSSIECVRCYRCVLACPEGEVKIAPRFGWRNMAKKSLEKPL